MVLVLAPLLAGRQAAAASERLLTPPADADPGETVEAVTWSECEGEELEQGIRLRISHPKVSGTVRLTSVEAVPGVGGLTSVGFCRTSTRWRGMPKETTWLQ